MILGHLCLGQCQEPPAACGVALEPRLAGAAGRACAQTNWPSQSGDQRGVAGVRHRCPVPEVPFAALPETPPPPHWLERVSWPYLLQPRGPDQRHCPPPAAARQSRLTPTSALIPCAPGYSAPESLPCASPPLLRPLAGWGGEVRRRGLADTRATATPAGSPALDVGPHS